MKTHEIYKALELRGFPGGLSQNEMTRLIDAVRSCIDKALREATHHQATEPAPSTAGERDNKTEMLAKLTAWLDSLGGKLHTYSLRGIALAGFEEGWSAALMQSTADHIAEPRKMVAALPVGELTLEQITRIYERYGGDMVNCTRAIERELAAASSQTGREPLSEDRIYEITGTQQRDAMMRTMAVNIARWVEQEHGITKKGAQ